MGTRRLALVVVGLLVVLSGCSGDGDGPSATVTVTETVGPSSATPTPTPTPTASPSMTALSSATISATTSETSSAPPSSPSGSDVPRTYDAALEHFDNWGSEPVQVHRFQTPSGNIYCIVEDDLYPSGCEIREGAVRDEAVCAGSPSSHVGRIWFYRRRAVPVCNTDTFWEPGAPVLGYGEAARVPGGDVMCLSETIGVTCILLSRTEGFFLHRGEYVIFNAG